jgi:hypothetical protein
MVLGSTTSWIRETILFTVNIHLELRHNIEVPPIYRHNTFLIVSWAGKGTSEGTLIHLNRCRLYMGISSLVEEVSGNRKRILKHIFEGEKSAPVTPSFGGPNIIQGRRTGKYRRNGCQTLSSTASTLD